MEKISFSVSLSALLWHCVGLEKAAIAASKRGHRHRFTPLHVHAVSGPETCRRRAFYPFRLQVRRASGSIAYEPGLHGARALWAGHWLCHHWQSSHAFLWAQVRQHFRAPATRATFKDMRVAATAPFVGAPDLLLSRC